MSLNFLFRFCALPRNNWTSTLGYVSDALHFPSKFPICLLSCFQPGKSTYRDQIKNLLHLLVLTGFSQWGAQTGIGGREEMNDPEWPGYLHPAGHSESGLLDRILCFQVLVSPLPFLPFWSTSSNSSSESYTISFCFPNTFAPFKNSPWDLPGGPVVKTPSSHVRGPRFNTWSRSWIPHAATKKVK